MEYKLRNIVTNFKLKLVTKVLLVCFWIAFFGLFVVGLISCGRVILMENPDIAAISFTRETLYQTIKKTQELVSSWGVAAPISFLFLYLLRPLFLVPGSIMAALSGAFFGPIQGAMLTMLGENISANTAFFTARYFGGKKKIMEKTKITSKLNKKLEADGLFYVLLLRFLWLPFDLVNYTCGLSKVKWKNYALGTFFGIIPGMLTFLFLGDTIGGNNSSIWLGVIFGLLTTTIGYLMHHSKKGQVVDL